MALGGAGDGAGDFVQRQIEQPALLADTTKEAGP
jgi:hypothetical protein